VVVFLQTVAEKVMWLWLAVARTVGQTTWSPTWSVLEQVVTLCLNNYLIWKYIKSLLHSADDVQKPCDFDYGSPLIQDGLAVGILSQQNNCQTSPNNSSIYTRLASYYYWIREEANTQPNSCLTSTTTNNN